MKRINTKIGDIFSVKIDDYSKKYIQYIANDLTQLNSDVIRSFKEKYPIEADPSLLEILEGAVDFYAHCVTKLGVKLGYWIKIGNSENIGEIGHILFRSSEDFGNPNVKISTDWWIWKISEKQEYIGKLEGKDFRTEIGSVIPPDSIVCRLQTGEYDFIYPRYS